MAGDCLGDELSRTTAMGRSSDREPTGSVDFRITPVQDNRVWKRHQDHLRERRPTNSTEERLRSEERQLPPQLSERDVLLLPRFVQTPPPPGNSGETRRTTGDVISRPTVERSESHVEPDRVVPLRRSHRVVKVTDRLDL